MATEVGLGTTGLSTWLDLIINQLVLWDPPVNYYSISRRQGSTSSPKHSASWHQLSGTLCLQLRKVPLPSPHSRHIWKQNCSLLHTTQSNISSAAGTSDSNSWHMEPPINVFDILHLGQISMTVDLHDLKSPMFGTWHWWWCWCWWCILVAGGCDPYCTVTVDDPPQQQSTSVVKNTVNPFFDEHFLL